MITRSQYVARLHKEWSASVPATRRRVIRSVRAISVGPVGEGRCAEFVLGARNVHARVLGEEVVGLEEDEEALHRHTEKSKSQKWRLRT